MFHVHSQGVATQVKLTHYSKAIKTHAANPSNITPFAVRTQLTTYDLELMLTQKNLPSKLTLHYD